jgi:hypothetical protein
MTPKVFLSLGAVAAVSLIAAGAVHNMTAPWQTGARADSLLLPDLADRIAEVSRLTVRQSGRSLSITREGDLWVLGERDNFPADQSKVRTNLVGLSELRRVEPKTAKPELYSEIEVEDPDGQGAKSRELVVVAQNGDTLAELIVGKTRGRVGGATKSGAYVRFKDDTQSWLAGGDVVASVDLGDWVDNRVMSLPVGQIERIDVTRGISFPIRMRRIAGDNRGFELAELPAGMTAKSEFSVQNEVRKMTLVAFDDVRRAAVDAGEPEARMRIEDRRGAVLTFDMRKADDGGAWIRVAAGQGGAGGESANGAERFAGYELHLPPDARADFMLTLADVVDVEAS